MEDQYNGNSDLINFDLSLCISRREGNAVPNLSSSPAPTFDYTIDSTFEEQKKIFDYVMTEKQVLEDEFETVKLANHLLQQQLSNLNEQLDELRQERQRHDQELLEYLENCRFARNDLKKERAKVESLSTQWRFYRHSHKQSEKMKKIISDEIDDFLIANSDKTLEPFVSFVKKIKKHINGEEDSLEEADEDTDSSNRRRHDRAKFSGRT